MSKFGKELIESTREALAIAEGRRKPAKIIVVETVDVGAIRKSMNLSQVKFAEKFGLSVATVRDWEQGRRNPDTTARTLLMVISKRPEAVIAALN